MRYQRSTAYCSAARTRRATATASSPRSFPSCRRLRISDLSCP